jgi:hypothetical protein
MTASRHETLDDDRRPKDEPKGLCEAGASQSRSRVTVHRVRRRACTRHSIYDERDRRCSRAIGPTRLTNKSNGLYDKRRAEPGLLIPRES